MPGSEEEFLIASTQHAPPGWVSQGEPERDIPIALLRWYAVHQRDLPWRRTRDPYAIWLSEVMLQQTRVDTVIPYYLRFLERFPTVHHLARAPIDDVLALWSGLGYYRRARLLHEGARVVAASGVPTTREGWRRVPGVGPYTAAAVASIAFRERVGVVDGNVARVLSRLFTLEEDMRGSASPGQRRAQEVVDALVPANDPGGFNQALMELGATVCTPSRPDCSSCPLASGCGARLADRVEAFPIQRPKAPPQRRSLDALVIADAERIFLCRRREDGLFGGLWEPPLAERAASPTARGWGVSRFRRAGEVVHVLTHRRLSIAVKVAKLTPNFVVPSALPEGYDEGRVVGWTRLAEVGVSTLARKVLATAESFERASRQARSSPLGV